MDAPMDDFVEVDAQMVATQEARVEAALSLSAEAERALVAKSARKVTVGATITARACGEEVERRPDVDIAVVLDRSGSMAGNKLKLCKETLNLLINELRASDSFGLVTFDHNVQVNSKLAVVGNSKEGATTAVERLRSGGTTNLSGGLLAGLELFGNSAAAATTGGGDRVRAVLLLTDGHANAGITDVDRLQAVTRAALPDGVQLYTFGYGSDHNADLLRKLASCAGDGRGGYYFVDSTDRVVGAFADCLGGLLSVVAQNVRLVVRSTNCVITRVRRDGAERLAPDRWTLSLGDVFAEERRDVLVDIEPLSEADPEIFFEMTFVDALAATMATASSTVNIKRLDDKDPALESVMPSANIATNIARLDVADAMVAAQTDADKGNLGAARGALEEAKKGVRSAMTIAGDDLLLRRLEYDLDECVANTSSAQTYQALGRQQMASKGMGHRMQRCMSDSDSDGEEDIKEEAPRARNAYRGASKKAVKSKWTFGATKK
ncbi:hypothetical protein CTAYLR_006968 [Chrysophaeum taylorii]|uniref:VWFA domain-containing protein n=1 Tax=Chrysophaeum taylorii TaxID=2483200 RepID=A0AAD7UE03_9STRA|nr:hypothetical protein CTAYLR_006968 [Chrysophaeum taylorii]